jgi:hypothetical protein
MDIPLFITFINLQPEVAQTSQILSFMLKVILIATALIVLLSISVLVFLIKCYV